MTKSLLFPIVVKYRSRVLAKLKNLIVVDNSKINRGFAKGVNIGIKQALSKDVGTVLLINPDLKINQKQINSLEKTPGDIVGPVLKFRRKNRWVYDFGGKVNYFLGRTTHWENTQEHVDYVSGACMLIRRRVFEKIGLFDERFFMYFEDVDFCLRAENTGFNIVVARNVIVEHQISEQRFSHNQSKIKENLKSNWKFINKWVPWYFRPLAYLYLSLLWVKTH